MRLLREPLLHFLLLGAALFVLFGLVGDEVGERSDAIHVGPGKIGQLVEGWTRTWQRPPTKEELEGLIASHIEEEIFYREALALGLDRDDTIVRRRLRQKMEFLAEDATPIGDPTEEELVGFLEERREAFRIAPIVTFRHVYLNADRRGDAVRPDAEELLAALRGGGEPATLGDRLPLPARLDAVSVDEVARMFGGDLATGLLEAPVGTWSGPVASGYGLHLVLVSEREDGRDPDLDEIRDVVRREWEAARRDEMSEEVYRRLRERYTVTVERPEWAEVAETLP